MDDPSSNPGDREARIRALESELARCRAELAAARAVDGAAALRESEARYRALFDDTPAMYFTVDVGATVVSVNRYGAARLGYLPGELVGRSVLDVFVEADRAAVASNLAACAARVGERLTWEARKVCRDGQVIDVRETASAMRRPDGGVEVLIVCEDITMRLRAQSLEAQLRQSQKMDALGTLAGGVAHDFNNLLAVILLNLWGATRRVGDAHPAAPQLAEIRGACERGRDLVAQILTFSRRQPQARCALPLRAVLDEAVRLLRATLPAGVELTMTATSERSERLWVMADRTQLHQVLINLGTNAWQAMGARGGRIDVALDEVDVDASRPRGRLAARRYARVTVRDDGEGIDAETLEHIFEPFFTTRGIGGTGLGLSVVHGIVTSHEGEIFVTSAPGAGAAFEVLLPLASVAVDAPTPPCVTSEPAAHVALRARVLFVDDDAALTAAASTALRELGHAVAAFTAPSEALDAFADDPEAYDLVLTDHDMPHFTGLEVARTVRRTRPATPVVMVSGYVTDELRAAAVAAGVCRVVAKPVTADTLNELVQSFSGGPCQCAVPA